MIKLVLPIALCLLSLKMNAQDVNTLIRKQHLSVRDPITAKDWLLRGPVKSVKECMGSAGPQGQQTAPIYCNSSEYSSAGLLLRKSIYSDKGALTEDSRYFYSNNRIDSITGSRKKVYLYDNNGRIRSIAAYGFYDENRSSIVMTEVFDYDKNDMIIKNIQTSLPEKEVTTFSYAYSKAGELTEQHMVSNDNDILYTNEFDAKGQLYKSKTVYKKSPASNTFTTIELNAQGDVSAMTSTYQQKAMVRTYQYQYDDQGNWLKQTATENGKQIFVNTRIINYYTKDGNVLTTAAADMPVIKQPLTPGEVIDSFVAALNRRQFVRAYNYCIGGRWGTAEQFSSVNMYGGITAARIVQPAPAQTLTGKTSVNLETTVYVEDPTNGDGIFVQQFQLQQKDGDWKIAGIKLISSTRASDNWSLNVPAQPDFTKTQALRLSKAVYDTVSLVAQVGTNEDTIVRTLDTLRFFKDDKTLYCVAVFSNQGPQYGASVGWCDILLFAKSGDTWQLTSFLLNAGGGGMYGYSGRFSKLLRMGDQHVAIVLSGGLTHMGENVSWVDIVAFHQGKLAPVTHINTSYEYDNGTGEKNIRCFENKFRFEKNGKPVYDLLLEKSSCGSQKVPVKKVTVPYAGGYKVPGAFSD